MLKSWFYLVLKVREATKDGPPLCPKGHLYIGGACVCMCEKARNKADCFTQTCLPSEITNPNKLEESG